MSLLAVCPGAEIADVPISNCRHDMGEIQKIVLQRIYSTGTTKNKFVIATNNPNVIASWTPFLTASDGTKAVQTPYVHAPATEVGEMIAYGGDGETMGGVEINNGTKHTKFTSRILSARQDTIEALKAYRNENVGVYLIDEHGRIHGHTDDVGTPTEFMPIPIETLFIGDKEMGGFTEPDKNQFNFNLLPNWSDKLHVVTPTDFDAKVQLTA